MPRTRLLAFAATSFTTCIVVVAVVAITWYIGGGSSGSDEARPRSGRRRRNDAERRPVAPHLANPSQDAADGSPADPSPGPQTTHEMNNLRPSTGESSSRRNLTVNSGLRNRRPNENATDGEGPTTRSSFPLQSSTIPEISRVGGPTTSNMSTERSAPLIGLNTDGSNVPDIPPPSYESSIITQPPSQDARVFSLPTSPFSESFSLLGGGEEEMQSFQSLSDAYAPQSSTILEPSRAEERTIANLSTHLSEPGNVDESNVSAVTPPVLPSTLESPQPPSEEIGFFSLPTSPVSESFSLVSGGDSAGEDGGIITTPSDSFRSFSEFGEESELDLESVVGNEAEAEAEENDSVTFVSAVSESLSAAGYRQGRGGLAVGSDDDDGDDADRRTFVMQDIDISSNPDSGQTGELDPNRTTDMILEDLSPSDYYDSFSDSDSSIGSDSGGDGTSGGGDDDEDNPQTLTLPSFSSSDSDEIWGEDEVDYLDLDLDSNDPLLGNYTPRSSLFSPFD